MASNSDLRMELDQGTILVYPETDFGKSYCEDSTELKFDHRVGAYRAFGYRYADVYLQSLDQDLKVQDLAKGYEKVSFGQKQVINPRKHQIEALEAWIQAGRRGVVELPTGAGKTYLAMMAILATSRPTLVIVPTIDLLMQWQKVIQEVIGLDCGVLGGGEKKICPLITVSTFDSALIHIEKLSGQFGLLIVDECHHLPAPQYHQIALSLIAPFRLGLSATVARPDGKEVQIFEVLGSLIYRGRVGDMVDTVLSPYDVTCIEVELTDDEMREYKEQRQQYTAFLAKHNVNFGGGRGWMDFVYKSSRLPGGEAAMAAYRRQKAIALGAERKLNEIWKILVNHKGERSIVFTNDNEMAYRIGKSFILPVLTHQTKLKERKDFLEKFRNGELTTLVTSKVLNEGVDVPEASVAIIVSGGSGVREHVQRLGRILRYQPGKRAALYELVAKDTAEQNINQRRKQHDAYQRAPTS